MTVASTYPNRLADERARAGLSASELAARAGIDEGWYAHLEAGEVLPTLDEFDRILAALGTTPDRLYESGLVNTIGGNRPSDHPDYARFFGERVENEHLLVSRYEVTWLEKDLTPDRVVDVWVNMSCGPQEVPHLLMNTMTVFDALGVSFAAGAGRIVCCGTYYRGNRQVDAGNRMHDASLARARAWGANTIVHWCTQCENTYTERSRRRDLEGAPEGIRHVQLHAFLEERLLALGDRVPWQRALDARVLVQGPEMSPVHREAKRKVADLLRLVPGVEVLGFIDFGDPQRELAPKAAADVAARRAEIAATLRARGANTIVPQHHSGQKLLSRYASESVTVRHAITLLAEALGVACPDRYGAAVLLGDPAAAVEQLRPVWSSWGITEQRARELADALFAPAFAAGPSHCTCGGGGACREQLISVDVLGGTVRRAAGA